MSALSPFSSNPKPSLRFSPCVATPTAATGPLNYRFAKPLNSKARSFTCSTICTTSISTQNSPKYRWSSPDTLTAGMNTGKKASSTSTPAAPAPNVSTSPSPSPDSTCSRLLGKSSSSNPSEDDYLQGCRPLSPFRMNTYVERGGRPKLRRNYKLQDLAGNEQPCWFALVTNHHSVSATAETA